MELINANQFAKAAGISPQTVRNMVETGELKSYPMENGLPGYDMRDTVLVFNRQLYGVTKGAADIHGSLYVNVEGGEVRFDGNASSGAAKINSIKRLLTDIRKKSAAEELQKAQAGLEEKPEGNIQDFKDYTKAIAGQGLYRSLQETIMQEFIKRYKRSADSYMTTLRKKYPGLGALPAMHLEDCVYYGVSKHDVSDDEFQAMFDIPGDKFNLSYHLIQTRMEDIFGNFAIDLFGINTVKGGNVTCNIRRSEFDVNFLNGCGRYYEKKKHGFPVDFDKDSVVQIYRSVQAKSLKAVSEANMKELVSKGFYRVFDVPTGYDTDALEEIFNETAKGYYNDIYFNVSKEDAKEAVPELYLMAEYVCKGTRTAYNIHYETGEVAE